MKRIKRIIPSAIFALSSFLTYAQQTEAPKPTSTVMDLGSIGGVTIRIPSLEELQANPAPQVAMFLPIAKGMVISQAEEFYKYQFLQKFLPKDSLFMDLIDQNAPMLGSLPFVAYSNLEKASLIGFAKKYGLAKNLQSSNELSDEVETNLKKQLLVQFTPKAPVTDEIARKYGGSALIKALQVVPNIRAKHSVDIKEVTNQILRDLNKGTSFDTIEKKYRNRNLHVISSASYTTSRTSNNSGYPTPLVPYTSVVAAKEGQIIVSKRPWFTYGQPLEQYNLPFLKELGGPQRTDPGVVICKVVKFTPTPPNEFKSNAATLKKQYLEDAARKGYQAALEDYQHTAPINLGGELTSGMQPLGSFIQEVIQLEKANPFVGGNIKPAELDNLLMSLYGSYMNFIDDYYSFPNIQGLKERPNLGRLEILFKVLINELVWPLTEGFKTPTLKNFYADNRINSLRALMLINPPVRAHLELAKMLVLKDNPESAKHLSEYLQMDGLAYSSLFPLDKSILEARAKSVENLINEMKMKKLIDDQKSKELSDQLSKKKEEALKTLS